LVPPTVLYSAYREQERVAGVSSRMRRAAPSPKPQVSRVPSGTAAEFIPPNAGLATLRQAAAGCTACPLYAGATQTVFGEGPPHAPLMLVGETPGDREDLVGRPFVGPAGRLLDQSLVDAGIERSEAYVTNAVKHFKWEPRGKRRLHKKPNSREIRACKPWVEAEIAVVKPKVLVLLGATAAQALLGPAFRVTQSRGQLIKSDLASYVVATVHPSSLLRGDEESREMEIKRFVEDLRVAAKALRRS
jgi:uracil-DNA glycosylase family protein